ncbi:MAG: hypothetical protein WCS70_09435 [Verrucomicrobiota bacterium]
METHKFGVKLFITNPAAKPLKDFIPVFHGWIQSQALPGHLLIDVHDYSHVHHGPGILLVSHEANLSLDEAEGRRGLVYIRKQPGQLADTIAAAKAAAKKLSDEHGVQFEACKFEVFVNDRLAGISAPQVTAAAGGRVTAKPGDSRERQTFVVNRE